MSMPTTRSDFAFQLAPHQTSNVLYNAQGSCLPQVIPQANVPIVVDSAYYPSVDCQACAYRNTPRVITGAGGSLATFGGYLQTQSFEEGTSPIGLPTLGPPLKPPVVLNYFGYPAL